MVFTCGHPETWMGEDGKPRQRLKVKGPNNFTKFVTGRNIPELNERLHKKFGLKIKPEDLKTLEKQYMAMGLYGGLRKEKEYKLKNNY